MKSDAMDQAPAGSGAPAAGPLLVEVERAVVTFQGRRALDNIDLRIRRGEHLALRGGNGAGKSTLLRLIRGEQRPDQKDGGRVLWHANGRPETSPLAGRGLAALVSAAQQERILAQGWNITGEDLVLGGLSDTVFPRREEVEAHAQAARNVARQLGAEGLLPRFVPALSQGQLRLLLVARALVRRPALLLLDEVTDGLDAPTRNRLLDVLETAAAVSTLILSTHRPETLPAWVRREVRLENGRIAADGVPGAGSERPPRAPEPAWSAAVPSRNGGVEIRLDNATVYVDRVPVLHELNWTIRPGRNWAVLGGNGAGKSTLLRLLAGDENVAAGGSISRFLPRRGGLARRLEDIRRSIRLVSDLQQATYGYDLTGRELVCSGLDKSVGVYREFSPEEILEADRCLERLDAARLADKPMRTCSTGETRRLLLARALMGDPELLLLDEPCSGLDPAARDEFLELIAAQAARGLQLVLVTHHESELIPALSHVLRLEHGRIRFAGER